MYRLLIFLVFLFFWNGTVFANPSVTSFTGMVGGNQQILIKGSGFGEGGPNVVLFDDFSKNISEGAQFPTSASVGSWDSFGGLKYSDPSLSNGQGARLITDSSYTRGRLIFGSASEVFISSMVYVPNGYRFPSASALKTMPNISGLKHHWLYYGSKGFGSEGHDVFGPNWTGSGGHYLSRNSPGSTAPFVVNQWASGSWMNIWAWGEPVRWTHWLKGNGHGLAGTHWYFQSASPTVGHIGKHYNETHTLFGDSFESVGMPYAWDRLSLVGYLRGSAGYPTDNYVIDDVYLAIGPNAAARIEIGNEPVYSNATKLAIATPDNWSNTQITATIREGGFKAGDSVYLFVIDAKNVPSKGFGPLTFGTGSATPEPTAPEPTEPEPVHIVPPSLLKLIYE